MTTSRQRRRRPSRSSAPTPWWGEGAAPQVRWPGVMVEIPTQRRAGQWVTPDGAYWFDEKAADFAEQFFPTCLQHHVGSEWNGRPFDLMPYQRVLVRELFGWKRRTDGLRRFRKVFLAVPKGSGKSAFGAGLGLFLAFFDGEAGAEVYAVANDRNQARIVFNAAQVFVARNPSWQGRFEVYRDSIRAAGSTEYFQVLSSDASTKHGFRPHGIIFDEFHAQPDRELYDTLYRGMGKRQQPVLVMITTAGDDDESICMEEWEYARTVLSGTNPDPTYLPMIYEARPDEDWMSETTWRRVNPGYGITMKADYFHAECHAAQVEPRKLNSFLQLHLNRWVNSATAWIPIDWWDACRDPFPSDTELAGAPCAVGIDMAQKIDLAAAVAVFRLPLEAPATDDEVGAIEVVGVEEGGGTRRRTVPLNYRIAIVPAFWLPAETLRDRVRQDGVPYDQWTRAGMLRETEGAVIDSQAMIDYITRDLVQRFPLVREAQIGYDPAFATEIAVRLMAGGFTTVEVLQNYKHLSEACQVFEALIKAGRVIHGGHRLLRWNLENVAVKRDDAGRIRPVKPKRAGKRIDGVVATIIALSRLIVLPDDAESEASRDFTERGLWT